MLVIDTQRFNGSKVDANADAGTDYAALVPGNKSGGGDDQGWLPIFVRSLTDPGAAIRTIIGRCWLFKKQKQKTDYKKSLLSDDAMKLVKKATLKAVAEHEERMKMADAVKEARLALKRVYIYANGYTVTGLSTRCEEGSTLYRGSFYTEPELFELTMADTVCKREDGKLDDDCVVKFCKVVQGLPDMITGAGELHLHGNAELGQRSKWAAACCAKWPGAK